MRRVEHLINDIRFNSNQIDTNRFSDIRLLKLFNNAQRSIQNIVFTSDAGSSIFDTESTQDLIADQELYSLPSDIYAVSSLTSVGVIPSLQIGSVRDVYIPLRKLSIKERGSGWGYIISGSNIILSPIPGSSVSSGLKLNYVKKLPTLSMRLGQISSFISATSISMSDFSTESLINFDDFVSVVDINGVIKQSGIRMTAYNSGTGLINTDTALVDIANGDYVVLGQVATSHPQIPDECEDLLTRYVERSIYGIDSSMDIAESNMFTKDEQDLIMNLFEKKDHDVKYPPILNSTYMNN